jgi:hypothetical protein
MAVRVGRSVRVGAGVGEGVFVAHRAVSEQGTGTGFDGRRTRRASRSPFSTSAIT